MNRLAEWKRRINATDFPDKQKACDGLDRIWATGEAGLHSDSVMFGGLFMWFDTRERSEFWLRVSESLRSVGLSDIQVEKGIHGSPAIQQLIDAAKRYKKLRDLAERAEGEL